MAYKAVLYHKTGFTISDIPANVHILENAAAKITVCGNTYALDLETGTLTPNGTQNGGPLQIVQPYPLSSIDIPGTWSDLWDVDYVAIGNDNIPDKGESDYEFQENTPVYVYKATPAPMPAGDVVQIGLTLIAITTIGGDFKVTGGMVQRTTQHGEEWGKYDEDDPLCTPSQPLVITTYGPILRDEGNWTFMQATVDLKKLNQQAEQGTLKALVFKATEDSFDLKPSLPAIENETQYTLNGQALPSTGGVRCFTAAEIGNAVAIVRSLNLEGAIIGQVAIPTKGISYTEKSSENGIASIDAERIVDSSGIPTGFTDAEHLPLTTRTRVFYGKYNRYGLITCAGNKCEYPAEDVTEDGKTPNVVRVNDPRPDGAPYFRFGQYKGSLTALNYIRGCQWRNVPLVYTGASGSFLAKENFTYSQDQSAGSYAYGQENQAIALRRAGQDFALSSIESLTQIAAGAYGGDMGAVQSGLKSGLTAGIGYQRTSEDILRALDYTRDQYMRARANQQANFNYSQNVVVPTINFPLNSDLLRDIWGNGVVPYQIGYSNADQARINKLLTMYGYKITRALTKEDIYPSDPTAPSGKPPTTAYLHSYVYIEATGATMASETYPQWLCDLAGEELKYGVRIWWKKPDPSLYEEKKAT